MKDPDLIYCTARDRPPDQRRAYLDQVCEGDPALRVRMEQMLALAAAAEAFIIDLPDDAPGEHQAGSAAARTSRPDLGKEAPGERIGQTLGRYKLLERVGEGGCGVVYVAEQTEPVRRHVALKVIKLGMDTRQVVARFEAERQAVAMMDHPNIAKVFDAGTTDLGRPFFVMELVRGIRITDYCDQAKLTTRERLALFIQVCQAIQHAHQKGIIHRDIKPSNILVTLLDGVPVPKVIDFGIAKATEGRLTDQTVFTQLHQFIGTPAYMSPEQADMSGVDIDTRSDIYSLGVLLYELLAGSTPFNERELLASGIDAMRQTIREQEPPRPSTRLAALGADQLTTTAKRRSAQTTHLVHQLEGDLDWISMKCLEKERARRYETANALAMDIKLHLNMEPVLARPPSRVYEFQRTVYRHKAGFAAAAAILLALLAGFILTSWQVVRARNAEALATGEARRATAAEQLAFERLAEVAAERDAKDAARQHAEGILRVLDEIFRPGPVGDRHVVTASEALNAAAKKLESELPDEPEQRARLKSTLGATFRALGFGREAIPLHEQVLEYQRATFGPDHTNTLHAITSLAHTYSTGDRADEALKLYQEATELWTRRDPKSVVTADVYARFGFFLDSIGRSDAAVDAWATAVRINPKQTNTCYWLGRALLGKSRYTDALPVLLATRKLYPTGPRALETAENIAFTRVMLDITGPKEGNPERASDPTMLIAWLGAIRQSLTANPGDSHKAKFLALLYLWLGENGEHAVFCRTQLQLAAKSHDPRTLDRAAKAYLLQAHPDPELLRLAIDSGLRALEVAPPNDRDRIWFLLTAAIAMVRDGKAAEAEPMLSQVIDASADTPRRKSLSLAFRAIARAGLGRTNEARIDLAALEELASPRPARGQFSKEIAGSDELEVWIACDEARTKLGVAAQVNRPLP